MLPNITPNIIKCRKCRKIFFLGDAKEISRESFFRRRNMDNFADKIIVIRMIRNFIKGKYVDFISFDDTRKALEIADTDERKIYIRRKIWRHYNDRIRE
jgi:hypothetical protein